jgi:rhodanese-related sulfurtransferase
MCIFCSAHFNIIEEKDMKHFISILLTVFLLSPSFGYAVQPDDRPVGPPGNGSGVSFEDYISTFGYEDRKIMKCDTACIIAGLLDGTVQLVDIRFQEEQDTWQMNFGIKIPLPELPYRLGELDTTKVIVTACPHAARSNLARAYLVSAGFDPARVKFATEGFVGLVEYLRGDKARDFITQLP